MSYVTVPSRAVAVSGGGTGTANRLAKFSSGVLADSIISDDGTNITLASAGAKLIWTGRAKISSPADAQLLIEDNAGTGQVRLFLGGSGASHPMIQGVSSDTINFARADGVVRANIQASNYQAFSTSDNAHSVRSAAGGVRLATGGRFCWSDSSSDGFSGTTDTVVARAAASVVRVEGASSALGKLLAGTLVEPNTAVAAGPNVITAAESGTLYTNEGATATNYHTLPAAAAGVGPLTFVVQDADGIRIVANTGDTIQMDATVSGLAGFAESTTVGNAVTLIAINNTEWIAVSYVGTVGGTWTVT